MAHKWRLLLTSCHTTTSLFHQCFHFRYHGQVFSFQIIWCIDQNVSHVYVIVAKRYIPLKCDCLCQNQHLIRFVLQDIIALAKITRKQMMMPSFLCWSITIRSSHLVYYLIEYHICLLVMMKNTIKMINKIKYVDSFYGIRGLNRSCLFDNYS